MKSLLDQKFMRLAIKEAAKNIKKIEGGPFGACIVKGGRLLALGRNKVLVSDATSHAEINAIRLASKKLKEFNLSGCTIYSTTEPCPMCFSAIHWARISRVVYGTSISDAKRIGFNEMKISNLTMKNLGRSKIKITSDFLRKECLGLLNEWSNLPGKEIY
jgi:tRNA(Arg) A34 adenosine deaminase TadA